MYSELSGEIVFSYNANKIESNKLKKKAKELLAQSKTESTETAKKKKLESALENLNQAAKLTPGGEYNYLRDLIETALNSLTSERIKKLSEEAITYFERKEYDEALEKINAALKLDPNNMHNKAIKKLIETAIDGEPGKQAHTLAGEAYELYESGDYKSALSKVDKAIELDKTNWQYRLLKKQIETAINPPSQPITPPTSRPDTTDAVAGSLFEPGTEAGEGKYIDIKGIRYTFRWCPAGSFEMGAFPDSYYKVHTVRLSKGFWMLETEVTQAMWKSVMGNNPSNFSSDGTYSDRVSGMNTDNFPVEEVSWNDCQDFCKKLSELAGIKVSLPTEAQWEYACRAGTTGEYGGTGNLDDMGWYDDNSGKRTHEVKGKQPNAWGLYDMHGNVWEWCQDWYDSDYYKNSPSTDPTGPYSGSNRVYRGGSWCNLAEVCRSASRDDFSPEYRSNYLGFRPVLSSSGSR